MQFPKDIAHGHYAPGRIENVNKSISGTRNNIWNDDSCLWSNAGQKQQ